MPFKPHRSKSWASVVLPALILFTGLALRLGMAALNVRFHPDEALFAAQARLISHHGDLLLRNTDLDKPPLTFFVTALSFRAFGPTEVAARLPNALYSSLSVALLYALAWSLYRNRAPAAAAALLLALSPYDLAFSGTVLTDVQATFWVLAASVLAVRDRWMAAGIAAALVFAAKSNALLFLPIILALGIAHNAQVDWHPQQVAGRLGRFALPLLAGISLVVLWDLARAPRSFLSLGLARNNPERLIRSGELWPRLERWEHWLGFITGARGFNLLLPAASILALAGGSLRSRSRAAAADWLIAGFGLAFLAWHWLIAFNTYDRYLHTLVPFMLLLLARLLVSLWQSPGLRRSACVILLAILGVGMLPAAAATLRGEAAIGGDQGRHTGIDALAEFMNTHLDGQIVYDHWLGWELAYYLGAAPGVQVIYMPQPEALADEMSGQQSPRYLAAPSTHTAAPWLAALERSGVRVSPVYRDTAHGFVVYELAALQQGVWEE